MNTKDADLLRALRQVKLRAEAGELSKKGICHSVDQVAPDRNFTDRNFTDRMRELFEQWPLYSGQPVFPIPAGERGNYARAARNGGMWDRRTEYGRMRWDLLGFMILTLERDIALARVAALEEFAQWVAKAPVASGICACGDDMAGHATNDHSPRDQWDYSLRLWFDSLGMVKK